MLNLKINIDPQSGFCFGVIYAIEMAEDILDEDGHLYCLGDIVHNDEEVNRLKKKGLKIITHEDLKDLKHEKVLIRAHGEPASTYKLAAENELQLIDASCPVVLKLQNRIKNAYDRNENIFIYGKHGHPEVIGLLGQTQNNAIVFQDVEELEGLPLPENLTLFSQTTKNMNSFYSLIDHLSNKGTKVTAYDTICRQVSNRDQELRNFVMKFDTIIFVSGVKSSNGKSLFEVCRKMNPNSYMVSSPADINRDWFHENESVGICGATSTPLWLMKEIQDLLKTL